MRHADRSVASAEAKVTHHLVSILLAFSLGSAVLAAPAQAGERYVGWAETDYYPSTYAPTHWTYAFGSGFRLGFLDNYATVKATRFKVCLTKRANTLKCWTSTAQPVKRITVTNWRKVGYYVVKWYVNNRVVATWPLHLHGE